jgi:phosphomannomutase
VYLGDGRQIVPPADLEISAAIDAVGPLAALPRSDGWQRLDDRILDAYLDAVAGLSLVEARDVRIAYTPLHGVGQAVVEAAFARTGYPPLVVVAEQADPDPSFPTVPFPNPEEPGAMDLALAAGAASAADVVIANDPDADRCAVAVRGRMLTGDELGALLADHILRHTTGDDRLVASSVVSSTLLAKLAAAHGVRYRATLTGFKWITRAADGVPGSRFVFGYEEAIGYCVAGTGWPVRDKDGIGAALLVAEMAAEAKAHGQTLCDRLDALAREHGLHATAPWTVRVADLRQIAAGMRRLREHPPAALGGLAVLEIVDLSVGSEDLPPTDGLQLRLEGGARVVVRPSGTEPKLKAYLEAVVPVVDGDVQAARAVAATRLDAVRADLAAATGMAG